MSEQDKTPAQTKDGTAGASQQGQRDRADTPQSNNQHKRFGGKGRRHGGWYNSKKNLWPTFKGGTEAFGAVLGTSEENGPGDTYRNFCEKGAKWLATSDLDFWMDSAPIFKGKEPNIDADKPQPIPGVLGAVDEALHYEEIKHWHKQHRTLKPNKASIMNVVWGQFTPGMKEELKGLDEYEHRHAQYDVVWILEMAMLFASGVNKATANEYHTVYRLMKGLFMYQQSATGTTDEYAKELSDLLRTVELAGGDVLFHKPLYEAELKTIVTKRGEVIANATDDEKRLATKTTKDKMKAIFLLESADPDRYRPLWRKLETDTSLGNDSYPTTWARAYEALSKYVRSNPPQRRQRGKGNRWFGMSGRSFAQCTGDSPKLVQGTDGQLWPNSNCYHCRANGHIKRFCPELAKDIGTDVTHGPAKTKVGISQAQIGIGLTQKAFNRGRTDVVNPNWILLDSCSTHNVMKNPSLVENECNCRPGTDLTLLSSGGNLGYTRECDTLYLPMQAYINYYSLANIYALNEVNKRYRVTMDSSAEKAMLVHLPDESVMKFLECGDGLYYFDTSTHSISKPKGDVMAYSFLNTVRDNKEFFHRAEIEGADNVRILQQDLWWPSDADLKRYLTANLVTNCDLSSDDVTRAKTIYGPARPILKGKMVRRTQAWLKQHPRVPIPNEIVEQYKNLDVCIDYFFVNGIPFFHTISKRINFRTTQTCKGRGKVELKNLIVRVASIYRASGFTIEGWHGDNEFRKIEDFVLPAIMHLCAAGEHVPEVERSIRTVKERVRCTVAAVPYPRMPKLMLVNTVIGATEGLNDFPSNNGVSTTLSPNNIVLRRPKVDYRALRIRFGSYVELYAGTTNKPKERSVGAIALRRDTSARGGYYFMSLETGKELHGHIWTELPITDEVLAQVDEIAEQEGQPMNRHGPVFEWEPGVPIIDVDENEQDLVDQALDIVYEDDENDENDDRDEDEDDDDDDDADNNIDMGNEQLPMISDDDEGSDADELEEEVEEEAIHDVIAPAGGLNNRLGDNLNDAMNIIDQDLSESKNEYEPMDDSGIGADDLLLTEHAAGLDDSNLHADYDDDATVEREERNTLRREERASVRREEREIHTSTGRPKRSTARKISRLVPSMKGKAYDSTSTDAGIDGMGFLGVSNRKAKVWQRELHDITVKTAFAFTQMHANQGFKTYGQRAVAAMFKEYKQLVDMEVFGRLDPDTLTTSQKQRALRAINLIKEKKCGKIKGRTCADGSSQREYVPREEATSPTASLDSFIASLIIDAHEKRHVQVFDVPGAFLQTDIPSTKVVIIKIEGKFVDIMCEVNPEFKDDVRYENGKKVLYLKALKAIYGLIESALLWYQLYTGTLKDMGFELNPYDMCVANKMINGKQCTIVFYVDDNKVSHAQLEVVDEIVDQIESQFFGKLTRSTGKKHTFLGIDIEFIGDRKVALSMPKHLQEMIDAFPEKLKGNVVNPAKSKLFHVSDNSPTLDEDKTGIFRSVVQKGLWICQRSRPDLETGIAFLTTRLKTPTEEDWVKLRCLMNFVVATQEDRRIIGADHLLTLDTYIDASHAIHNDMRGQTGGAMTFGWGVANARSIRQKLNTKSTTESEIVGVSDYVPRKIWMIYFLDAQGYKLSRKTLHQDNEASVRMETNGKDSSTSRSRHIHIRYFFVADRVKKGEFTIQYCHTHSMLADYFTKPLQGRLFNQYREVIMGWKHVSTLSEPLSSIEERVENNAIERKYENITDNKNRKTSDVSLNEMKISFNETNPLN